MGCVVPGACGISGRCVLGALLFGQLTFQSAPANAVPGEIHVLRADFAKGALVARDNFRVAEFYKRGEKAFPKDTHFDDLNWAEGFSEVWLYALRSARLALLGAGAGAPAAAAAAIGAAELGRAALGDKEAVRRLRRAEQAIVSARGGKALRKAWRQARGLLEAVGPIGRHLAELAAEGADGEELSFVPTDSTPRGKAADFGAIGALSPQRSVHVAAGSDAVTLANGVAMPYVGLGTTMLNGAEGERAILEAVRDHGYRLVDTAEAYGNEAEVGRALAQSGVARSELFIATKLSEPRNTRSASRVRALVKKQLKKLNTTYIDLYFLHGPDDFPKGCVRAWHVLEDLYRQGTVRALGVSNFDLAQLEDFRSRVEVQPHAVQNKFSIYHHGNSPMPEEPFLQAVQTSAAVGTPMAFMGYCNLDVYPNVLEPLRDPHVDRIAAAHNCTTAQVLLRHALQMGTTIIPKTSGRFGRLAENMDVFRFTLSDEEMWRLNGLAQLAALRPVPHVADLYGAHRSQRRGRVEL